MQGLPRMAVVTALVAVAAVPPTAHADWTSNAGPPTVMTGSAGDDPPLTLGHNPFTAALVHNQPFGRNDPFVSEEDFSTSVAGKQGVGATTPIAVNGNGGADALTIGDRLSDFRGDVSFDGGAGADSATWSDSAGLTPRSFTFLSTSITGGGGGHISWAATERMTLAAGAGDDR